MGDGKMMKKILESGLNGPKESEFQSGYKTALSVVYGTLAQGIGKEQLMDGLEDFFHVGEWQLNKNILYS